MKPFIEFWEHISSGQRMLVLMGGMLFFWTAETLFPLVRFSYKRYRHAGVNLVFIGTSMLLNLALGYITLQVCARVTENNLGLFNVIEMPVFLKIIACLLGMDLFSQYLPHYAMHKWKWMWKFHLVHHSDTKVDVTTGTRHHPGEWIFRETGAIIGVVLLGLPVAYYFLYRSVSGLFTHFNHANLRVPLRIDKAISLVFVSPHMHKAHHHFERPLTDTNFSNIFSLWDRLFGTFAYADPHSLKYGLDVLDDHRDEDLRYQLGLPFDRTVKTDY